MRWWRPASPLPPAARRPTRSPRSLGSRRQGRLELVGEKNGAPIFVDYAHKPDALAKALEALRPYAAGSLTVVFGCGGDRDPGKRPMMGAIAAAQADRVVVTDDIRAAKIRRRSAPPSCGRPPARLRSATAARRLAHRSGSCAAATCR